jgi:hypothetical protein
MIGCTKKCQPIKHDGPAARKWTFVEGNADCAQACGVCVVSNRKKFMGRFARSSERDRASDSQATTAPRPSFDRRDSRTPSEARYFVLAVAALIGLGIGWLAGKAITGSLHSTATTPAVAEQAVPATFDGVNERPLTPASAESDGPTDADASVPEAGDSDESSAPMAVVTQATTDDSPARVSRRAARRAAVRRAARGNPFLRPFRALRRFRVW